MWLSLDALRHPFGAYPSFFAVEAVHMKLVFVRRCVLNCEFSANEASTEAPMAKNLLKIPLEPQG